MSQTSNCTGKVRLGEASQVHSVNAFINICGWAKLWSNSRGDSINFVNYEQLNHIQKERKGYAGKSTALATHHQILVTRYLLHATCYSLLIYLQQLTTRHSELIRKFSKLREEATYCLICNLLLLLINVTLHSILLAISFHVVKSCL